MKCILQFESVIQGHHVYHDIWMPVNDETILCMEDNEKKRNHLTSMQLIPNFLVSHVLIEHSKLIYYFLNLTVVPVYLRCGTSYIAAADTSKKGKRIVNILAEEIKKLNDRY